MNENPTFEPLPEDENEHPIDQIAQQMQKEQGIAFAHSEIAKTIVDQLSQTGMTAGAAACVWDTCKDALSRIPLSGLEVQQKKPCEKGEKESLDKLESAIHANMKALEAWAQAVEQKALNAAGDQSEISQITREIEIIQIKRERMMQSLRDINNLRVLNQREPLSFDDMRRVVFSSLSRFVMRVTKPENATPEELAALPAIAELIL